MGVRQESAKFLIHEQWTTDIDDKLIDGVSGELREGTVLAPPLGACSFEFQLETIPCSRRTSDAVRTQVGTDEEDGWCVESCMGETPTLIAGKNEVLAS